MFARYSLAVTVVVVVLTGCNKVAPKVAKAAGLLDDAAKAAPAVERNAAGAAARAEGRAGMAVAGAERGAKSVPKTWAERIKKWHERVDQANEAYNILCEIVNGQSNGQLGNFPQSASEVKPTSNQEIIVGQQSGGYALPNNVGGYSFYTPAGKPLGFCAYNTVLGEMHFFDYRGVRVG